MCFDSVSLIRSVCICRDVPRLNDEVLKIVDDALGLQATLAHKGNSVLYTGATMVWNKTLADGDVAVALLNTGDFGNVGTAFGDFNISFGPEEVGLVGCSSYLARDLFKGKDLGTFEGGFWREVDESSMLLLRLHCK